MFAGRRCFPLADLETVLPEYSVGIAILACRPEGLQVLVGVLEAVDAAAPVFAAGDLSAGDISEVVVLLRRQRIVADVERHAAQVAHVVIELQRLVVRRIDVRRRGRQRPV